MLDSRYLRADIAEAAERLKSRNFHLDIEKLNALENKRKEYMTKTQDLQAKRNSLSKSIGAAMKARELGLGLNAGHDLSLENLKYFHESIPWIDEVSIGHALICDALYMGLQKTVQAYLKCLD